MLITNMEKLKENVGKKVRCTFGWCEKTTENGIIYFGRYTEDGHSIGSENTYNIILLESKSYFNVVESDFEKGGYIQKLETLEDEVKNLKVLLKYNNVVEIACYGELRMGVVEYGEKKIKTYAGVHDIDRYNEELISTSGMSGRITKIYKNTSNGLELIYDRENEPIDWSKVEVDTLVLVRQHEDEEWIKRHFAKYEDGKVYVWTSGMTSFTTDRKTEWEQAKLYKED